MKLERTWNVFVIHHSHTDIGYTERQDKIIRYHYDFIRQAIDILDETHKKGESRWNGFVWQCENYWQVENFCSMADEAYKKKFEYYVSTGEIGLSGNYLNMTELISESVLDDALDRMEAYGNSIGHPITAGMCADINGMAWGYGEALYRHGVRYFYSSLHPHHGMFPLYKKVLPFYWETPKSNRILVWNGDHYHLGNELFLAPHAGASYMIHDEFSPLMREKLILNRDSTDTNEMEIKIAETRIERYLENLEDEGYPYDIVPIMVSGAITDNAPPGRAIAARVSELNVKYDGRIVFRMGTLEQFFQEVEERCGGIVTYRGDWTDWWADGVGSTPAEVKLYREAVRKYGICRKLDLDCRLGNPQLVKKSAKEQMLYAEHTWGYSSSVSEPWESLVSALELKKGTYAVNSNSHIAQNLDQILAAKGEVTIRQDKPQIYCIVNPHGCELRTKALLYIGFWEYINGVQYDSSVPIEVIDCATEEVIESQVKKIARATQVEIEITMKAGEERRVAARLADRIEKTTHNHAHIGAEGVCDLLEVHGFRRDEDRIETDYFVIGMNDEKGICSIIRKSDGQELIRKDVVVGAFGGVYEITELAAVDGAACETRRRMGRNRKSKGTKRYESFLKDRKIMEDGSVYTAIALDYSLEGTGMYTVFLKAYKHIPKLEVMVRIHKESRLEPENLYVALPFTAGEDSCTYVDKTGCIIRPGIDQLLGSCQDFYLIQTGVLWQSGEESVAVITKDAPLISLGDLKAHPVMLCNGNDWERNGSQVHSWVMNNYWETNFKVNLGGFYEFSYMLLTDQGKTPEEMFKICEAENEGLVAFDTK